MEPRAGNKGAWWRLKKAITMLSLQRQKSQEHSKGNENAGQGGDLKNMKEGTTESNFFDLTDEQHQIIRHPDGYHGRVLAVAGSGKTTTMAHRVKHLVDDRGVRGHQIQVLMFNRLARVQFREKLVELGMSRARQPHVDTFHSYAYRVSNLGAQIQWIGDREGLADLALRQVISVVARQQEVDEDEFSLDEVKRAISLWKGALVPPTRAGYSGSHKEAHIAIYEEFEKLRLKGNAVTYDDYVPLAVALIEGDANRLSKHVSPLKYIIVDEYQDINLGQERLVELLASHGADVMVVGDDDQTIYEWRGARSEYILREYMTTFDQKPHLTYQLTRSFRFGYCIAQASFNVISHNTNRNEKTLIAHDPKVDSQFTVVSPNKGAASTNRSLADEIIALVKSRNVTPSDIRVLGRTFAQLNSLSSEFLLRQIPFKIEGGKPFLKSGECEVLLDYIRVAASLDKVPNDSLDKRFLNIANKPFRYLGRDDLRRMLRRGQNTRLSLRDLICDTTQDPSSFKNNSQRENLENLLSVLEEIDRMIRESPSFSAGRVLDWIDQEVGLQEHYENYYGEGEIAFGRTQNISAFRKYAHYTGLDWRDFIDHVESFDSTLGKPEETWIRMTTIHRTKGLEFDYIFIPDCQEGFMPVFAECEDLTYDTQYPRREPKAAEWIENERRLFYVGATRARNGLFIGAPAMISTARKEQGHDQESSMIASRFLEECELEPTLDIAHDLVLAARHEKTHRLAQRCGHWASYHKIVGLVKEHYSCYFTRKVQRELAQIQMSDAERPFKYKQRYIHSSSKYDNIREPRDTKKDLWDWIPTSPKLTNKSPKRSHRT